jgi:hypothetical protein
MVAAKKEKKTSLMHQGRLGKGERFADEASQALAQGSVPPFDMSCLPRFFSGRRMLLLRDHRLIGWRVNR